MLAPMPVQRVYVNWGSEESCVLSRWEVQALAHGEPQIGPAQTFELPEIEEVNVSRPHRPVPPDLESSLPAGWFRPSREWPSRICR